MLVALMPLCSGFLALDGRAALEVSGLSTRRSAAITMKGRGTRGMPGKGVRPPQGSGFNKASKSRMARRDFDRDEWQLVAEKTDLSNDFGATKAVSAGISPQGQDFIWVLVRGDQPSEDADPEDGLNKVYATDGSCRCCLFPMTNGVAERTSDGVSITCGLCGTKYSLEDGEVLDFCPKKNPVQWAAAMQNENKGPVPAGILPTRVSKAGRVYLRLPDGTLTKKLDAE